jgi:glycogen debranching enzyme
MWESGLDNSPMWDDAVFNQEKHCLELSYVGLNALLVADCQVLARMAALLGREAERAELEARGNRLAGLLNGRLWSQEAGSYLNRHWDGRFSPVMSLTHFYPFLAGIVSADRSQSLLAHLTNPEEFWGEHVIPNVSRRERSYADQDYWRGRIWGPTNFLVSEGLRRVGARRIASEVAARSLATFLRNWRERGIVSENYNATSGVGSERSGSDPFYHWGALMVFLSVQEFFDPQTWNDRIRVGGGGILSGGIRNLPFRDAKLAVALRPGPAVSHDGRTVAAADGPLELPADELAQRLGNANFTAARAPGSP